MFKEKITMYVWGTPVRVSYDVYIWVIRGETRTVQFKRAYMVLNKRRKEQRYV